MNGKSYSFVYDKVSADAAFHGIAARELTLSVLAGLPPQPAWDGCLVYQGPSPLGGATVCIATQGSGADELQLRLVEVFERQAIPVLGVYEGGPEVAKPIATARAGRWSVP